MIKKIVKLASKFEKKIALKTIASYNDVRILTNSINKLFSFKDEIINLTLDQTTALQALRYLQALKSMSMQLNKDIEANGISLQDAKKYKSAMEMTLFWLSGLPGLKNEDTWFKYFNEPRWEISNFEPRAIWSPKAQVMPEMTIIEDKPQIMPEMVISPEKDFS